MGFEPTTYALRVRCSTPELKWRTNSLFPILPEMSRGVFRLKRMTLCDII